VIPILTPEEMAAVDRAAPEPVELLIGRAGAAVARHAERMLGGTYGRQVVVVAGKGNNGNDGREAAARLARRGVRVHVIDAADAPRRLPQSDLVIDAAYGTGFRGEYAAPDPAGAPVLAVDIPSGVDGLTGQAADGAARADATVTFAALKPGLVLLPGRRRCGEVVVVDIGLDVSAASAHLVEPPDVAGWLPARAVDAHKWQSSVWVVAGSPGMTGAAVLATRAAQRAGAGYVRLSVPGAGTDVGAPVEVVTTTLQPTGWSDDVVAGSERFTAFVVGPGLGPDAAADVRSVVGRLPAPVVVDGDGLNALGRDGAALAGVHSILTPHDKEYERLTGAAPGPDRLAAARRLAATTGGVALVKGPTTVVADGGGRVLVSTTGTAALATAGTGDVLSGIIGALCAGGLEPPRAAAAAAVVHGLCGLGFERGLVAGDLPERLPAILDELSHGREN
jgi:NAD(P)H-hydrate epimerase